MISTVTERKSTGDNVMTLIKSDSLLTTSKQMPFWEADSHSSSPEIMYLMGPEDSFLCSKESAAGHNPELDESSQ